MSEENCIFVSSRGLMKCCDYFSKTPQSSIRMMINYPQLKNIQGRIPIIYVTGSAIPYFIQNELRKINFKFVLVSGDCDEDIPNNIFRSQKDYNNFINDERIVKWYTQNWVGDYNPKVFHLPIGMDYHTMTNRQIFWGSMKNPFEQESVLKMIIKKLIPFWKRRIMCYSNFHFSMNTKHSYDRKNAIKEIPRELIFYEKTRVNRLQTWLNQKDYAFVVSPFGGGYDCHRTWEALMLGCIPIVMSSGLNPLFEDLPVLIVKKWEEVTKQKLQETIEQFKNRKFKYAKLTLKYWMDQIRNNI